MTRKNFELALVEKGRHNDNQTTIYFLMMEKKMVFIVITIVCTDTEITSLSVI